MAWRRLRIVGALGIALLAIPGPAAHAQQSAPEGSDTLLREALAEFNAGRWDEAYALFKRMHSAEPSARALRGMGLSAFEARRYAAAVIALKAALIETRRPLSDAQRAEVQEVLARADGFVARFQVRLSPSHAQLTVDGREPLLDGRSAMLLDPGMHEIVAAADGHESVSRTLSAQSGDRRELAIELRPKGQVNARPPVDYAPQPADAAAEKDGGGVVPILAYVAAGGAVLFAGAGIGLHFAAKGAAQDVEDTCQGNCTAAQADWLIDDSSLESYQTLSFVGYGLAAACAITATTLFVIGASDEKEDRPAVAVGVAPAGLTLAGSF